MQKFEFKSSADGLTIRGAIAVPEGETRAALQIAHGMAEHKERYYGFMEYLARRGVACVINDHRGHGESLLPSEAPGYFGKNGGDALVEDMKSVTDIAKARFPGAPFFLLGHSMGALAARTYVKKHANELSGLIITGNPGENSAAELGRKIARAIGKNSEGRKKSALLNVMMFMPFVLGAPSLSSRNAWICTDKSVVKAYDADPLCGFMFTANGYDALLSLMLAANAPAKLAADIPALFLSGRKDPCMGGAKKLEKAAKLMRSAGCSDVETRVYPGMRHEILNKLGQADVFKDIAEFIDKVLTQQSR